MSEKIVEIEQAKEIEKVVETDQELHTVIEPEKVEEAEKVEEVEETEETDEIELKKMDKPLLTKKQKELSNKGKKRLNLIVRILASVYFLICVIFMLFMFLVFSFIFYPIFRK